jgi:hypothetical protein
MSLSFPILDTVLHPPYGAMRRELISGVFSGSGTLTRATGAAAPFNNVNAYGLRTSFFTVPIHAGRELGSPDVFLDRVVQLTARYDDALGNADDLEVHNVHFEHVWLWLEPGPALIHYEVFPNFEVVFEWIIVKFP